MGLRNFRFSHLLICGGRVGQEERSIELHHHPFKTVKEKVQQQQQQNPA